MLFSLALLPALAAAVYAQGSAVAASTMTPDSPLPGCNSCFIVADVAQVIFADFTTTQTQTAVVSAGVGRNVTVFTTYSAAEVPFSFNPNGIISGSAVTGSYVSITGTTYQANGVTLTSPTAYNVFTGYTAFTLSQDGSSCVTSATTTVSLASAYSYNIPANAPGSYIFQNEMSFINAIGGETCVTGGVVVSTTVPVAVTTTTTTSSTTGFFRPSSLAAAASSSSASAASSTGSSSVAGSSSAAGSSTSIVQVTPTINVPTGAGAAFGVPSFLSTSLLASLFVLPGFAAVLL